MQDSGVWLLKPMAVLPLIPMRHNFYCYSSECWVPSSTQWCNSIPHYSVGYWAEAHLYGLLASTNLNELTGGKTELSLTCKSLCLCPGYDAPDWEYLEGWLFQLMSPELSFISHFSLWLVTSALCFNSSSLKAILVNSSGISLLYIKFDEELLRWDVKAEDIDAQIFLHQSHSHSHKQGGKPLWSRTEGFQGFLI